MMHPTKQEPYVVQANTDSEMQKVPSTKNGRQTNGKTTLEMTAGGQYLDSLHLMTTLADARLLPAHGPVGDSMHARVGELLAHHDDRLAETLAALGDRTRTAHQVAGELGWTRRKVPFADLGAFDQMLAVNETAAHLDVLVARGRARRALTGGVNRYVPTAG